MPAKRASPRSAARNAIDRLFRAGEEQVDAFPGDQHGPAQAAGLGRFTQPHDQRIGVVDRHEVIGGDVEDHRRRGRTWAKRFNECPRPRA
jgi:hypothetical protein